MRKILKILNLFIVCSVFVTTNSISYANPNNSKDKKNIMENKPSYNLNINYVNWNHSSEPFEGYHHGNNIKQQGERLRLPVIGETIEDKIVYMIDTCTEGTDVMDELVYKISKRENSFRMPACHLSLSVIFHNIVNKKG